MSEPPVADTAQPLVGLRSNDEWASLLADLDERIERLEALPDGPQRQQMFALLDAIDAVHREALLRLVRLFKQGVLEQVVSDPAIHTLMELYDLLPPSAAPEPGAVPGRTAFPTIPIRAVAANRPKPSAARYPHWVPALQRADELPPEAVRSGIVVDDLDLLLARRGDQWFALASACPVDGAALDGARLSGYTLSCPHHPGCHYDVRNGARIGGGAALACHPVKVDEQGRVMVGLDMDFHPAMPGF